MSKQHPGPWNYRLKQEGNGFLITDANDSPFAVVHMTNDPTVAEANARLFAGGQDLLEACKTVLAYLDKLESFPDPDYDPELSKLRRRFHAPLREKLEPAIKKAAGE